LSARRYHLAFVIAVVVAGGRGVAHADARGLLRIGVAPLALEPSSDTPVFGSYFDDAVTAYNTAAGAYNRAHGYAPGSAMATAPIQRSALGLRATMVTFAPTLELGGEYAVFRLEGLIGISDTHRALGIGAYPLDLAYPVRNGEVVPYFAAGGTVSWLDRTDVDGEVGGLVTVRAALGVRVARRVSFELGYGMFMVGGVVDSDKLHSMAHYDPRGAAPPPQPDRVVAGGEQSGMIDVSLGVLM
jgi:hypothetical protein